MCTQSCMKLGPILTVCNMTGKSGKNYSTIRKSPFFIMLPIVMSNRTKYFRVLRKQKSKKSALKEMHCQKMYSPRKAQSKKWLVQEVYIPRNALVKNAQSKKCSPGTLILRNLDLRNAHSKKCTDQEILSPRNSV
jgi:hypothetical protein